MGQIWDSCNSGLLYYKWNEMRWPRSHRTTIYAVQILVIQFRKLKKTLTLCFIDALTEWKKLLLTAKKPVWTFVDRKQPRRTIFPIICDASAKTGYQNGNSRFQAHFLVTGIGEGRGRAGFEWQAFDCVNCPKGPRSTGSNDNLFLPCMNYTRLPVEL